MFHQFGGVCLTESNYIGERYLVRLIERCLSGTLRPLVNLNKNNTDLALAVIQ